jgi:hypothetical protein
VNFRLRNGDHEHVRHWLLRLHAEAIDPEHLAWLESHLACCAECSAINNGIDATLHDLQGVSAGIVASRALVRSTQMRMRERAAEIRREKERMSPLWLATALAAIWALISAPFLWYGFEWMGNRSALPALVWQTLFVFAWLMPFGLIVAATLWTRGARFLRNT